MWAMWQNCNQNGLLGRNGLCLVKTARSERSSRSKRHPPGRNGLVNMVCLVKNGLLSQNALVETVFLVETAPCESKRAGQNGLSSQKRPLPSQNGLLSQNGLV